MPSKGIFFVDAAKIVVCNNKYIPQHRMFANYAIRGKSSVDWFDGLKMHFICDHLRCLISYCITKGYLDKNINVFKTYSS